MILSQFLIILWDGNDEDDSVDIFEAMNPFLPLRSLTSDVEDTEDEAIKFWTIRSFGDIIYNLEWLVL